MIKLTFVGREVECANYTENIASGDVQCMAKYSAAASRSRVPMQVLRFATIKRINEHAHRNDSTWVRMLQTRNAWCTAIVYQVRSVTQCPFRPDEILNGDEDTRPVKRRPVQMSSIAGCELAAGLEEMRVLRVH
jgi:hypothetical protein